MEISELHLNESSPPIPLNKPIKESSEKQAILLLGGQNRSQISINSLLMLENNGQNWEQLNIKLPYAVEWHGAQFLNNNIYIFGGQDKSWKPINWTYKLSRSLQWEKMADMNQQRDGISNSSVILNNQIWVCGGDDEGRSVEMYDPETNKWKYIKQMNESRWNAAAAVVDEKIYCSGGCNRNSSNSVECYDLSSDVWTEICNMPQRLRGHCAVEIDGNFIVMGGAGRRKNVWALNTRDKNAKWIEKPAMSTWRYWFSIAKIDNKIYVCGGNDSPKFSKCVDIFDGDVWRNGPKMPTTRAHAPAVVIPMSFARYLK